VKDSTPGTDGPASTKAGSLSAAFAVLVLTVAPLVNAEDSAGGMASLTELVPTLTPVPDYSGSFAERYTLLGDFDGARQDLYDRGIAFDASFTQVYQGVTDGGTDETWEYHGLLEYGVSLDTGKLGWWPGGVFVANVYTSTGDVLLGDAGNIAPVNFNSALPDTDPSSTFPMEYYLTQALPTKTVVTVGRINPSNFLDRSKFANDRKTQFLNAAMDNNVMVGSFLSFSTYAVLALQPISENITVYGAVVDSALQAMDYEPENGLFSDLAYGVGADIRWEIGDGLGGSLNPVLMYTEKDTAEIDNPFYPFGPLSDLVLPIDAPSKSDNYAAIATLDQYLWKPGGAAKSGGPKPASDEAFQEPGLGLTVRGGIGPEERNPFDAYVSVALGGRGIVPGRPHDRFGVGAYALFLSAEYEDLVLVGDVLDDEVGVEAFYTYALTPAVHLSANVQWIDAGIQFTDDTWVLGTRLFVRL
jgi:porin